MPEIERPRERPTAHRVPVARISAVAALAVGAWLVLHESREPHWRTVSPGIDFAILSGDPWCRRGSSSVAVLRVDPARARLRVQHYSTKPGRRPLDIVEWQRETGALAVFNAGQFYPDWSYMGLLVSSGRVVSDDLHPGFQAALVAGPESRGARRGTQRADTREIRVLDLARDSLDPGAPGWREVAQSFMLIDRRDSIRVRKSDRVANRTLVAEDGLGRILAITTEGGYTLRDLADFIRHTRLGAGQVMVMDGGYEAEMCVRARGFRYGSFGRWTDDDPDSPGARTPLPAVITVDPK
ncbi:MAG TPA: phosphodiester glycosidase family protein [Candidatus Udaeobacter sp.]|jgi:hypothetical protein|nr:phosphodiester glycosidase family protein [Candidatus Udaeobacter sp.]